MGKPQSTEAQPPKQDAAVAELPNGILKHEPVADAMELDGPQMPADGDVEKMTPPRWRWRLLSFTLLPGAYPAAFVRLDMHRPGYELPTIHHR